MPSMRLYALTVMSAMLGLSLSASELYRTDFIPLQVILFILCILSLLFSVYAFGKGNFMGITEGFDRCFSHIGSRIILAAAALYFIAQASLAVFTQKEMIKLYLLTKTPDDIIITALTLTSAFLFYTGLRQLAGTAQLLLFIIAPLVLLLLSFALYRSDPDEIRILLQITPPEDIRSSLSATCALWGIESVVFFLGTGRYAKTVRPAVIWGFATVFILFLVSFLVTVGTFSLEGSAGILFPLSEMSRILNVGGLAVTERFDVLFLFIQIIGTVIRTAIAMYCASVGLSSFFGLRSHRCFTVLIAPAVVLLACSCTVGSVEDIVKLICSGGFCIIMFAVIPLFAAATFIISRRKGAKNNYA